MTQFDLSDTDVGVDVTVKWADEGMSAELVHIERQDDDDEDIVLSRDAFDAAVNAVRASDRYRDWKERADDD
jgi:hypothetical protein